MISVTRSLLLVGALLGTVALAQPNEPMVVLFPLQATSGEAFDAASIATLRSATEQQLATQPVLAPDSAVTLAAYDLVRKPNCHREAACLAKFAQAAASLYALSVEFSTKGTTLIIAGRLVRDDGKPMAPTKVVELASAPDLKVQAKVGLAKLYADLGLDRLANDHHDVTLLSLDLPEATAPEPKRAATPLVVTKDPSPAAPRASAPLAPVGIALAAVGAAGLAVGATLTGLGAGQLDALTTVDASGQRVGRALTDDQARKAALLDLPLAQAYVTAGIITAAVSGAVLLGGVVMWAVPPPTTTVTVAPTRDGAVVVLSTVLP